MVTKINLEDQSFNFSLNEFGIKAEPSLAGEIAVTLDNEQPYYLSVDVVEELRQITINTIKFNIETFFTSEFTKNFYIYMSSQKLKVPGSCSTKFCMSRVTFLNCCINCCTI